MYASLSSNGIQMNVDPPKDLNIPETALSLLAVLKLQ